MLIQNLEGNHEDIKMGRYTVCRCGGHWLWNDKIQANPEWKAKAASADGFNRAGRWEIQAHSQAATEQAKVPPPQLSQKGLKNKKWKHLEGAVQQHWDTLPQSFKGYTGNLGHRKKAGGEDNLLPLYLPLAASYLLLHRCYTTHPPVSRCYLAVSIGFTHPTNSKPNPTPHHRGRGDTAIETNKQTNLQQSQFLGLRPWNNLNMFDVNQNQPKPNPQRPAT